MLHPVLAAIPRGFFAFAVISSLIGTVSCQGKAANPPAPVIVAYSPFESTALFWIARDQQFFTKNGLEISLRKYDTGAASLSGMLNGESDITVGLSEFPVVRMALQKEKMAILGNTDKGDFIFLVGRNDRGINIPADLKGKRAGVTKGTIAEFYLGRFLELNGIQRQDIAIVDLKTPDEWIDAIIKGDIDVVVTAQPYVNTIKERLGDNGFFWTVQSGQFLHGLIVATDDWEASHPDLAVRFIKSIAQAEEYASRNPDKAKAIVQRDLNLDSGYIETVWAQNQFSLNLDQGLILAMEDEARWMISNNLTAENTVPDFLALIYADAIRAVKPGAVRIIGE